MHTYNPDQPPRFDLLRKVDAIVDRVPDGNFYLDAYVRSFVPSDPDGWDHKPPVCEPGPHCGTIACAMGWAALNPEFQSLGLYMFNLDVPLLRGRPDLSTAVHVVSCIFNISMDDARCLFGGVRRREEFHLISGGHKAIWKNRLKLFFAQYNLEP